MKNTIGSFIAALRKANGMTQQDMADRLNVSNKAVSRWERDECAPDISLIPAIAEMFGITCDELLKGERITESLQPEKKEHKVEKQLKSLINRTLSGFKTLIWISIAVALAGVCFMFGISYGILLPVIGFFVMLLFEVCSFAIAALGVSRTKLVITDNELFDNAPENTVSSFYKTLGSFSFTAFFTVISAVTVSLPVIFFSNAYSVLSVINYLRTFSVGIILLLTLIYLKSKKPYLTWITGTDTLSPDIVSSRKTGIIMTLIQCGLTVFAVFLFFIIFKSGLIFTGPESVYYAFIFAALLFLLGSIICFTVFIIKYKTARKMLIIPGIRNIFFIAPVLYVFQRYYESATTHTGNAAVVYFHHTTFLFIIFWVILITMFFELIARIFKRKRQ